MSTYDFSVVSDTYVNDVKAMCLRLHQFPGVVGAFEQNVHGGWSRVPAGCSEGLVAGRSVGDIEHDYHLSYDVKDGICVQGMMRGEHPFRFAVIVYTDERGALAIHPYTNQMWEP